MKQYNAIKAKHPDALLLFRVGDFYETFHDDAVKTANILGIVLTKRANGAASEMHLAGFPYHALDTYLPKLVRAGQRVAICEQLEDPKTVKTIVKRGVTEMVTPGVAFTDKILEHKSNNFLAAVYLAEKEHAIAFADVSTGEFLVGHGNLDYIEKLLQNFSPTEVIYQRGKRKDFENNFGAQFYSYPVDDWVFAYDYTYETLTRHFQTNSLKGFGIDEMQEDIIAAGAVLHYLQQMQQENLKHINSVARIEEEKYLWLDRFTIRNLELVSSPHEKAKTLLEVIDRTITPMGSRLLKRWILLPLKLLKPIEERLDVVDYFIKHTELTDALIKILKLIGDLERLVSRLAIKKVSPRELVQLKKSLSQIAPLKKILSSLSNKNLIALGAALNDCEQAINLIEATLSDDAGVALNKGNFIKSGFNQELDDLRSISTSGKDYLLKIQARESERTGISSLKVAYNNVFGYYIEVTNTHKDKVPVEWQRKQTLANAERYITPELKEYEEKILGAEEKILAIELQLFNELINDVSTFIHPVQSNANIIARIDCLLSYAAIAVSNNYVNPQVTDSFNLSIKDGRHPVLEKQMPLGEEYVANDVYLDSSTQQIIMITGPNMSGKSALLRQTALIVLLAQIGCFVPAKSAEIGLVDKIFTRVGASDNISSGESTFMVEMNETASILNNISERSLILLDEIGRGTSTYDGISIAWAIAEFLHGHTSRPKTLFATHYHELNEMEGSFARIKNYSVSIKEAGNRILFLRKLVKGGSEHSFGIHVAKLAGMPSQVVHKAEKMLNLLENAHSNTELVKGAQTQAVKDAFQLSFFQLDDPALESIRDEILKTDINTLTPVEALIKLNSIKNLLSKK
ncbi:MAG TPA: DNA mismatch repair protein MutS [Bacteroidia bacterium]|nr:DNA mismatch repair protein MutS [Bacteroidia bacterium]HNU34202.1 DNA mismatch repair protein MutS [Bacteroidia bacterium]